MTYQLKLRVAYESAKDNERYTVAVRSRLSGNWRPVKNCDRDDKIVESRRVVRNA